MLFQFKNEKELLFLAWKAHTRRKRNTLLYVNERKENCKLGK